MGDVQLRRVAVDRLLDEVHAPRPREPGHQVVRALEHEIPAEVRETDRIGSIFISSRFPGCSGHAREAAGIRRDERARASLDATTRENAARVARRHPSRV